MNIVVLMGRLARDPFVGNSGGGENSNFARFNLAVDRRSSKDDSGADFIDCVAFGRRADFVQNYLKKGTKIALRGRIRTGHYTNKDGVTVYTTDVVADDIEFAESRKNQDGSQQGGYNQHQNTYNSQQGGQRQQNAYNGQQGGGYQQGGGQQGGQRQQNAYNSQQGGYNQQQNTYNSQQGGGYQQGGNPMVDLDGFMNIPDGIDEELPFS